MKTFAITRDEIKKRLDTNYYQPFYSELEEKVIKNNASTLNDYIEDISGGATPNIKRKEIYYTDNPQEGIPFIRVQNLSPAGLKLEDVKYITPLVHEGMLKRSQSSGGDLLVKITGVGRMAVSSVVPDGYKANINQHIVRIKTKDKETSEVLATYLNSDIGERLASRRATGATRPALDYEALKSIPVVYNTEIVQIMQSAYETKKDLEQKAEKLAKNNYKLLLEKLSLMFKLPTQEKTFVISIEDMVNNRIDPMFYSNVKKYILQTIADSKNIVKPLSKLITDSSSGYWGNDETKKKDNEIAVNVLRNTNFDNKINLDLKDVAVRYVELSKVKSRKLFKGDLLIEKSGGSPSQPVGRVCLWNKDFSEDYIFSNFLQKISINKEQCLPEYLFVYLRALYNIGLMEYFQNQTTGIKNLIWEEFIDLPVILPKLNVQSELAEFVLDRNKEIIKLEEKIKQTLEKAKAHVEELILKN